MKRFPSAVAIGLLLAAAPAIAAEDDGKSGWHYDRGLHFDSDDGRFSVNVANRLQLRGRSTDNNLGSGEHSFDLANYKLMVYGHTHRNWGFGIQFNFREEPGNQSFLLEDAWIKFRRWQHFQVWAGQGKVPFGRQLLTTTGDLQFVDRSIAAQRFHHTFNNADNPRIGRDVGIQVIGESESYQFHVGAFNGNGINQDGDDNQSALVAIRLAVTPLGPMPLRESNPEFTDRKVRIALGVSALTFEEGVSEPERINLAGIEAALQVAGFSFVGEVFTENEDEQTGTPPDEVETDGWYAQAGWLFPIGELGRLEFAGRVSEILEEEPQLTPFDPRDKEETGGAVSLYFAGHEGKIQADWRKVETEGPELDAGTADYEEFRVQLTLVF
jgi:hypothetical protein